MASWPLSSILIYYNKQDKIQMIVYIYSLPVIAIYCNMLLQISDLHFISFNPILIICRVPLSLLSSSNFQPVIVTDALCRFCTWPKQKQFYLIIFNIWEGPLYVFYEKSNFYCLYSSVHCFLLWPLGKSHVFMVKRRLFRNLYSCDGTMFGIILY